MKQVWHPLLNETVSAHIKYDKDGNVIEIKYRDGYKVTDESYIEDILFDSGIIKQKSASWITQ